MTQRIKTIRLLITFLLIFSINLTGLAKPFKDLKMEKKTNAFTNFSDTTIYVLKVIKKYDTFFAEWLDYHDKQTEDRYDAIECEVYCDNKITGVIYLVQHWNQADRRAFPMVGTTFLAEKFDLEQYFVPVEMFNINFSEIKIIEEK